jgi:phage/plasmid-associated DNA primase
MTERLKRNRNIVTEEVSDDVMPPAFSEDSLAKQFADRYRGDLRYVYLWRRWMYWGGKRWHDDNTLTASRLVRKLVRETVATANDLLLQKRLSTFRVIDSVEKLAQRDDHLAATTEQWDADPWALNTPGGVVNLKNGDPLSCCQEYACDDLLITFNLCMTSGRINIPLYFGFGERILLSWLKGDLAVKVHSNSG